MLQRSIDFPLSTPGADVTFASKLADDKFWTLGYATQVEREYRRFLYLTQTAGHMVCPSKDVDAAWHQHLTQTQSYQQLCSDVLGQLFAPRGVHRRRSRTAQAPPDVQQHADTLRAGL